MTNPVTLTFHLSTTLMAELSQSGVYAYLWNNLPVDTSAIVSPTSTAANPATNYFTTLVENGQQQGGTWDHTTSTWTYTVQLTDDSIADPITGGKLYFLVQSDPAGGTHYDLTSEIGNSESQINPTNAVAWNLGYDVFEVALTDSTGDAADISAINSFGHQLGVSVTYLDGSVGARGYSSTQSAADIDALINAASQAAGGVDAVIEYPTGSSLAGKGMIAITPATTQQLPSGSTLPDAWTPAEWTDYVAAVAAMTDIRIVGYFNGAKDANGVYHNAGYYAYTLEVWSPLQAAALGATEDLFVLTPDETSQVQGVITITASNLMNNLWSPGLSGPGTAAYVYTDTTLTTPFDIDGSSPDGAMNTGANNQWGAVFTQFFTGFSGGYYGGTGEGIPAVNGNGFLTGASVNLNQNWNWDPTYAFDNGRTSGSTIPSYQHYDPYAKVFFDNSNVYGGAYSDALTAAFTTSVLLPVWNSPGSTTGNNVSNIDLWAFGASETMTNVPGTTTPFYTPNTIDNYIAPPTGQDYDLGSCAPMVTSPGVANVTINLANNGMLVDPAKANIQLGIYTGNGKFQYVALPTGAEQNGGGFWQQWQVTEENGQFAISSIPIPANPNVNPPNPGSPFTPGSFGSLSLANFPIATDATLVYQLVVGTKTFTFYATTDSNGNFTEVASDGLGVIALSPASQHTFTLSVIPGTMNALASDDMIANTDASYINTLPVGALTAPVAGTLSGTGVFEALTANGAQSAPVNSTLTLDAITPLYFGWTGLSDAAGVSSWISGVTNKINPRDLAQINIQRDGVYGHAVVRSPGADIDGEWQTTRAIQLDRSGTYVVTMTEHLPDGTLYGAPSSSLTITVALTSQQESSAIIEAYSPAELAALAAAGVDILDTTDGHLTLDLAQALALGSMVLSRADLVTVLDTGAAIGALNAEDLRDLDWRHVDILDASDDVLTIDVAQLRSLGRMELAAGDLVTLADAGTVLAGIGPSRFATLGARGIDVIDATDDTLSLNARKALALGTVQLSPGDIVTLHDSSPHIESLTPGQLGDLATMGFDRIELRGGGLTLSLAQFDALGGMQVDLATRLTVQGTTGDDLIAFTTQVLGAEDRVEGGAGGDTVVLSGDGYAGIALRAATLTDIETLAFGAGHDYAVTTHNGTVAAGRTMTVAADSLGSGDGLVFDGAAERDGSFNLIGGAGDVTFTGGNSSDLMQAGSGADVFRYTAARQSTGRDYDVIDDFDAAHDSFDIWSGVTAMDTPLLGGTLNAASVVAGLQANLAGLGAHHAVLFQASAGTLAGVQFLAIDTNGTAGFQSGDDLVIRLDNAQNLASLGLSDFV